MNRALYIIAVPVLIVAVGYMFVFRYIGLSPGYPRLLVSLSIFFAAIWWLTRRVASKPKSGER